MLSTQKPDIVFFGESCPAAVSRNITKDCAACDLVLVMGTSLKVKGPVTALLDSLPDHVPVVLINNELVYHVPAVKSDSGDNPKKRKLNPCDKPSFSFAAALLGPCDDVVQYICETNEWTEALAEVKENHRTDVTSKDCDKYLCEISPVELKNVVPVRKSSRKRPPRRVDSPEADETSETGNPPAEMPELKRDAAIKLEVADHASTLPIHFVAAQSLSNVFQLTRCMN